MRDKTGFSLRPDPWMRWIYDYTDPRYNSQEARDLRERRDAALRSAPQWMIEQAKRNDAIEDAATTSASDADHRAESA